MKSSTIIIVLLVVVIAFCSHYLKNKKRKGALKILNDRSPKITFDEYLNYFKNLGYSPLHITLLYKKILILVGEDQFNFYPEDNIGELYFYDGLDDVEIMDGMCLDLNLPKASQEDIDHVQKDNPFFNATFVLDLISFIKAKNTKLSPPDLNTF